MRKSILKSSKNALFYIQFSIPMNKISQYLLILIAAVSVGILGYHAYTMATDTYSLPFAGQEAQTNNTLKLALAKPWLQFGSDTQWDVIDSGALLSAIRKNGKTWNPTVSGEGYMVVSGEYIEIGSTKWEKNDTITISAKQYNSEKKIGWKIPRDVTTSYSEISKKLEINPIGLPRDMTYQVEMVGYKDLKPGNIKWYMRKYNVSEGGCDIATWNPSLWKNIWTTDISIKKWNNISATYKLNIPKYPSSSCIVAGIAGDFEYINFTPIREFVASGSVTDMLSPEYDMQSRIEFSFSTDIFADSGTLYSDEYIEHRHREKIEFLKKLSISWNINILEENIELSPNKAIIYANLFEWKKYTIDLDQISDIYGRSASVHFDIVPKSIPSLAMRIIGNKTIIKYGDPIPAKLYRSQSPKNEYSIKLCQLSMEWYARVERMNELKNKEHMKTLYALLSSTESTNCTKKTITFAPDTPVVSFDVAGLNPKWLLPWLYILAFQDQWDVIGFDRWVAPRVFAIVDTHITMKIDTSGKMEFLATDIRTGEPRSNQDVILNKNISQLYTQNWNSTKQSYDTIYTPLWAASWGTGISLWKTNTDGTLSKKEITQALEGNNPYNYTSEWWGYDDWSYNSFVASSKWSGHFGYVVSTWNDGITGWNFGMKESDYGWDNRSLYSTYLHTDRRLYLPWETVYIKAIMRKNGSTLSIPENEVFDINISDPEWKIISNTRIKANAYGSLATNFKITKESPLGSYNISVQSSNNTDTWISNWYTNFQVEIFKNPTFTAEVKLSSPEVKDGIITTIRESTNTDTDTYWYNNTYTGEFNIEWIVKAHYYNGATIKSVPFTYRIYKSQHYDTSYWSDCFWGCWYEPTPEFYTEGTGSIDADGFGILRAPVEFLSYSDDYIYTVEVSISDPLTGETVTTPGTLLVGIGANNKMFDMNNPLESTVSKRMITPGESLRATIKPKYGKWDPTLKWKYRYELVHRSYTSEKISTLRGEQAPIIHSIDTVVRWEKITDPTIVIDTKALGAWEYFLRVIPITKAWITVPKESIHETLIYLTGNFVSRDNLLRVIPEKTIYQNSETARVLITTPFSSGGYLYITRERGGVIDHEYIAYSGSTYTRDYPIDESFYPNVYIGAIAFPAGGIGDKGYAVGYSEIIMDLTSKKWALNIKTDKETYKNRDTVSVDITLSDKNTKWTPGEIEIMVIDESLIRLLGNIDLDIIPKFFQKYPFTMKTALTAIGIERNRFLSRKWSNGGSGDKGWDGAQISSRTLFQNTAYYNPSVLTDANGKATVKFQLPDNVTDYRIIAIGQTKLSQFSVTEKTIAVRRDYTLETHTPTLVYQGDKTTLTASAFNSTIRVTPVQISLEIGTGGSLFKKSESLILSPSTVLSQDFPIEIGKNWEWDIPYTFILRDKGAILDSITKTIHIAKPPIITDMVRVSGFTNTGISISIPRAAKNTNPDSKVTISISDSPLQNPEKTIESMLSYPYGCIEQTISSTMPNAVALKLAATLSIKVDLKKAQENLSVGVAKILKMQDPSGGWKYWENDSMVNDHITPYVVRSLYDFRALWISIPTDTMTRGLDFVANGTLIEGQIDQMDQRSEMFATLARGKHAKAQEIQKSIDLSKLSRHGYLMYHVWLSYLRKLDDTERKNLDNRMNARTSESYWYWDDGADRAIYARLLIKSGDMKKATDIIVDMLKWVDFESYYVSTQTKLQLFMAVIELSNSNNTLSAFQMQTGILKIGVRPQNNSHRYTYDTRRSILGNTIDISEILWNRSIYYDISMRDEPLDIFQMPAKQHRELWVTRVFEKIDESKGIDSNWQFISATPNTNGIFRKWDLYRVRITVTPNTSNTTKYYLTLEDYIPGGWRPINSKFNTESSSTTDASSEYGYWNGWTHTESREDRILATQDYVWRMDHPYTYTYYIRPEYVGTYLLPPVTAYYMYQPEIHSIGKYEKVVVQ
jgi:hypothetical protein